MERRTPYRGPISRTVLSALVLLIAAGCQWQAPVTRTDYQYWRLDGADPDSVRTVLDNYEHMSRENEVLRDDAARLKAELANSRAENDHQKKINEVTSEELRLAKSDLERVEKQFVSFEERLTRQDTKASAVAAIAEVQLVYDRVRQESPDALDRQARAEIDAKIASAEIRRGGLLCRTRHADHHQL